MYVVATPIGNLEDMSYRAVRVLGEVDVVAAEDTRSARTLFDRFDIRPKEVVSYFDANEAERASELVARLRAGASVAVISEAGTPGVSDPGWRLVAAAREAGVRVEVVPGPVAAIAALVGSGLPTDRFMVVGFPPREPGPRRMLFGQLRSQRATLVLYEAPGRVAQTLADLADALGGARRAAVCRELTKLHEETVRGTLAELHDRYAAAPPRGECTLVVAGARDDEAADQVDIAAELRALLDAGLGPKDAAARLVVATGKPRRALYQLALSLQRERERGE
ncbi:MAG: 16S rRNA (cytidine(1402)-2'-O)-methyltransferase [Deltaproteobacteria bacterium]|nr:MAG: 16S rRNA (cytidine(1402)-2'-O)-methyltransferase [Deltaproteobacteria bacterium]